MAARQYGFFHGTPEKQEWKIKWGCTRLEAMREKGQEPRMPDIENGAYLFDALCVLGPMRASGMGGFRAADWPEIVAFAQATGRISHQREFELLYEMAQEFVQGLLIGNNLFGIEPMDQVEESQGDK